MERIIQTLNGDTIIKDVMIDIDGTTLEEGIDVYDDSRNHEGGIVGLSTSMSDDYLAEQINNKFY